MTTSNATPPEIVFPNASVAGARVGIGVRHIHETGSTNTDLAREARSGDLEPCVLVADLQTAGRGRLDRVWEAEAGRHLLMSFRLPATPDEAAGIVVAVAAAVRQAVASLAAVSIGFKWPNDLMVEVGDRPGKLAGVLAEYVVGEPGAVVVGVGLNVGAVEWDGATSVVDIGGGADRDAILTIVLDNLASRRHAPDQALEELRTHSLTLGRSVRVELPDGSSVVGTAVELGQAGELIVEIDGQRRSFHAGDVVHLRPA